MLLTMKSNQEQERYNSYYSLIAPQGTIIFAGSLLYKAFKQWPGKTALIADEKKITYKELYTQAASITAYLLQKNITVRDKVLLLWQNSAEFYSVYFGIWQTGAIVIPVNTFLHEQEIISIVEDAQTHIVLISQLFADKMPQLMARITCITEQELTPFFTQIPLSPPDITIPAKDPEELALLLYTSGTTGKPKGVMLSSRNILINAIQGSARLDITGNERIYAALPLFHSFTQNSCIWSPFLLGASVIVIDKIERKALKIAFKQRPTIVFGVPALYGLFALFKNIPIQEVKYCISGGDALPDKIRAAFELVYRRKICNGYGLTETAPYISVDISDYLKSTYCVGKPFIGISYAIKDSTGALVSPGVTGTLWVHGDNVMMGYYNAPEATQAVLVDGWFNTGDIAYQDTEGALVIIGREKDVLAAKGIKIYPQEIENILLLYPQVTQAAVIGYRVDNNDLPIAFVAAPDSPTLKQDLKTWCQQHLAPYKVPHDFVIVRSLPTLSTGKIDKKKLIYAPQA